MADSLTEARKEAVGAMFNLSAVEPNVSIECMDGDEKILSPPPLPPMQTRPDLQNMFARAPPPLKRMSTTNSTEQVELSENDDDFDDDNTDVADSASLFPSSNKKSTIDSVVGKLIATKQTTDSLIDFSNSTASSPSDLSGNDRDSAIVTPPPLRKCVSSPDPSRSRRKQSAPQATNDRVTESPPRDESSQTIQVPDIDQLLTDCAVVTPVDVPNVEIESDDGDEDFCPMRVSRKGRVVKKPSWADVYTDHTTTETEEDGCMEWTPEKPGKPNRSNADSFKPRAPVILPSSASKHNISHDDLHPSMIMENTPPALILPFKLGWIRELVIRNPQNLELRNMDGKQTPADAYYYAPKDYGSVKLRSLVRVQDFLMEHGISNLSSNNFSFCKRSIYKSPEEFVRLAGKSTSRKMATAAALEKAMKASKPLKASSGASTPTKSAVSTPERHTLINPKTELPEFSTGQFKVVSTPSAILKEKTSRTDSKTSLKTSPVKRPASNGGSRPLIKKIKADKDAVMRAKQFLITSTAPPSTVTTTAPKATVKIIGPPGKPPSCIKKPQPCSHLCNGVANKVPSVQCGVCLLLYHPECINWTTGGKDALFVCSICIMKSRIKPPDAKISLNGSAPSAANNKISSPLLNQALNRKSAPAKENKGRLITIPYHVLEKIDTSAPFALKLNNNETFKIDPSRLIKTSSGVRILIKNDQVLQPSEVVTKPDTSPPPERKYASILDCYKQISTQTSHNKDIPQKPINESQSPSENRSLPDNAVVVKQEVLPVDSEELLPIISDVRSVSHLISSGDPGASKPAKPNAVQPAVDMEISRTEPDVQSEGSVEDGQLIKNLLKTLLETVSTYCADEQKYGIALKEHNKAASATPVLQVSPSEMNQDTITSKLNNMNKPTDHRPNNNNVGCVGSMSEILYDQKSSGAQTLKTYGKQGQQSASDQSLRSLIPKSSAPTTNTKVVTAMTTQSGSVLVFSGGSKAVSAPGVSIGPVVLGSGIAPLANSGPVKPVTIVSSKMRVRSPNAVFPHTSALQLTSPGNQMKPFQVQVTSAGGTKYVLVNPAATGNSLLAVTAATSDKPLFVSSVSQAGSKSVIAAGQQQILPRRVIESGAEKVVTKVIHGIKKPSSAKGTQTELIGAAKSKSARSPAVDFSMTGSIYATYECLLTIFKHLSVQDRLRAARVCKMWREVSLHPSLNKRIDIERKTSLSSSALVHVSKLFSSQLSLLKLGRLDCAPTTEFVNRIVDSHELSTLALDCSVSDSESWLTEEMLAKVLALPKLKRLTISGGITGQTDLDSISSLSSCSVITHLSLKQFQLVHIARVIDLVTRHNPDSIQSIECIIAASHGNPFEEKADPGTLITCIQKCANLTRLTLRYPRLEVDSCEAEYLKDNYVTLLPGCEVTVQLYD